MPHTSRKRKAARAKRRELVDDDGWTRITTSSASPTLILPVADGPQPAGQELRFRWGTDGRFVDIRSWLPVLQKIHTGLSVEKMRVRYNSLNARWRESASHIGLSRAFTLGRISSGKQHVSKCLIFGSGSFSAALLGREDVAYYQLAAFKSAVDAIEKIQGHRPLIYAQEPFYTELDVDFLDSLGVAVIDHPRGFELIDYASFVYSPCAERWVELQVMYNQPRVWLHGKFGDRWPVNKDGRPSAVRPLHWMLQGRVPDPQHPDWAAVYEPGVDRDEGDSRLEEEYMINHQVYETFKQGRQSISLPNLDASNYPFQDCFIHWPIDASEIEKETLEVDEKNLRSIESSLSSFTVAT